MEQRTGTDALIPQEEALQCDEGQGAVDALVSSICPMGTSTLMGDDMHKTVGAPWGNWTTPVDLSASASIAGKKRGIASRSTGQSAAALEAQANCVPRPCAVEHSPPLELVCASRSLATRRCRTLHPSSQCEMAPLEEFGVQKNSFGTSATTEPTMASACYKVFYTREACKKRKSWESGVLSVKEGKGHLYDEEGKHLRLYKTLLVNDELASGQILRVSAFEIEAALVSFR